MKAAEVETSYAWCTEVARSQAKNFYYSFLLLDSARRRAMCAMYAFMRYCDDLSDSDQIGDRAAAIARWRDDLESALAGSLPDH
ncbi:MAG TPA: squalene/phytoene synthase family protein, partial [Bryobacteraceae bacterium]|nr:squalene/phytoene synthase family protein [Bryobacteraceae bacterium]